MGNDFNIGIENGDFFYSADWRQEVFAFGSLPFFDLMIDGKYLYLIKMPEVRLKGTKEHIISFLSLFLGLVGFFAISDLCKQKYYKTYRSSWINVDKKIISRNFEGDVFLKVQITDLQKSIKFGKNKVYLSYGGRKIVLVRKRQSLKLQGAVEVEFSNLSQHLIKYFPTTSIKNKFSLV